MNCPLCQQEAQSLYKAVKDHTVSQQDFEIQHCESCALAWTHPMPSAAEIGPYYKAESYISHTNTKKGLMNRMYHIIRANMLFKKVKMIERHLKVSGKTTVDVGAGTGYFVKTLGLFKANATGFEPDADARAVAKNENDLQLQPIEALFDVPEQSVDLISMWHVMEHVHEVDRYFEHYHKILKSDGLLVIAVPNYKSYDQEYYKTNWAAWDVPRHLWHFSPKSMEKWGAKHGFELIELNHLNYDPAYISMMSAGYKGSNKWLGLLKGIGFMFKSSGRSAKASSPVYFFKKQA